MAKTDTLQLISTQRGRKVYRVRGQHFEIEDSYTLTAIIGQGAYGMVCSGIDDGTLDPVAIKRVGHVFEDLVDGRRMWRELLILRLLKERGCRNIINLLRVVPPKDGMVSYRDLYIITDLYDTDVCSLIRQQEMSSIDRMRNIACGTLRCLADMHAMGIIHRDIKPSNILLQEDELGTERVAVCDFGLARAGIHRLDERMNLTDYVITRWYRAPEVLLMCPYRFPVDVWAVGCVMAECVLRRPLFPGRDYINQLHLVVSTVPVTGTSFVQSCRHYGSTLTNLAEVCKTYQGMYPLEELFSRTPGALETDETCISIIKQLLAFEPSKRLTAMQALDHIFFKPVGGNGTTDNKTPPLVDLAFDMHADLSEFQLRREIWREMEHYQNKR